MRTYYRDSKGRFARGPAPKWYIEARKVIISTFLFIVLFPQTIDAPEQAPFVFPEVPDRVLRQRTEMNQIAEARIKLLSETWVAAARVEARFVVIRPQLYEVLSVVANVYGKVDHHVTVTGSTSDPAYCIWFYQDGRCGAWEDYHVSGYAWDFRTRGMTAEEQLWAWMNICHELRFVFSNRYRVVLFKDMRRGNPVYHANHIHVEYRYDKDPRSREENLSVDACDFHGTWEEFSQLDAPEVIRHKVEHRGGQVMRWAYLQTRN